MWSSDGVHLQLVEARDHLSRELQAVLEHQVDEMHEQLCQAPGPSPGLEGAWVTLKTPHDVTNAFEQLAHVVNSKPAALPPQLQEQLVLLLDGEPKHQAAAAKELAKFGSSSAANCAMVCQTGIISTLVGLLRPSNIAAVLASAVTALDVLASDADSQAAVREEGGVSALVGLLQVAPDSKVTEGATAALGKLANNASSQAALLQAGGPIALVRLLGSTHGSAVQQQAAALLATVARDAAGQAAILEAGGIGALKLLTQTSSAAVKQAAVQALSSLTADLRGEAVSLLLQIDRLPAGATASTCAEFALSSSRT